MKITMKYYGNEQGDYSLFLIGENEDLMVGSVVSLILASTICQVFNNIYKNDPISLKSVFDDARECLENFNNEKD